MKHKLARREIEKYAINNGDFTTREIQSHLLNKKKSYHMTVNELGNVLARLPYLSKTSTIRVRNRTTSQWKYEE